MRTYKKTIEELSFSHLPEHWDVVRLGDVASLTMGQSPPSETYNKYGKGIPFLQGKAEFGNLHPTPIQWCSHPQRVASIGSVLISVRAPVGDVNVADQPYCIGRGLAALHGTDRLDNGYLFYQLIFCKHRLEERGTGSTFKSINKGVLQEFIIPLPPLPEQRAIAHVLSTVRQAIEATERVIEAAWQLKRSMMKHLFTYGPVPIDQADQVVLKETEIGKTPQDWEIVKLMDVAKIERGKFAYRPRNAPQFYGGSIPFIQTGDVAQSGSQINTYSQTLNELGLSISRLFPKGTIVITIAANIGYTGILEFDSAFPDSLIGITPNDSVLNTYLEYYLQTQRLLMDEKAPRGTQKNINIEFLKPWPVKKPSLDIQNIISHMISIVEQKISSEENRKVVLESLFNSLLNYLMTGKVRVHIIDIIRDSKIGA